MTDAAVQAELLKATRTRPQPGESPEALTLRVLDKANALADKDPEFWNGLSEDAQAWVNINVTARDNNAQLTLLVLEEEEEATKTDEPEAAEADAAEEEGAEPEAESSNQESDVQTQTVETPKAKARGKGRTSAVAKKAAKPAKPAAPTKKAAAPVKPKPRQAAKTKAGGARGRTPLFADTGIIKVLVKENPHREGTVRDKAWKKLQQAVKSHKGPLTVEAAVKAGCPRQQVWSMVNRKVISVTAPR